MGYRENAECKRENINPMIDGRGKVVRWEERKKIPDIS